MRTTQTVVVAAVIAAAMALVILEAPAWVLALLDAEIFVERSTPTTRLES